MQLVPDSSARQGDRLALAAAGACSLAAGLVHLAVVPEHLSHWGAAAVFLTALAAAQLAWGVLAAEEATRAVLLSGLAVSLVALAVWTASRTVGLPFGPEAGEPERVGPADLACVLAELAVGAVVAALLIREWRRN